MPIHTIVPILTGVLSFVGTTLWIRRHQKWRQTKGDKELGYAVWYVDLYNRYPLRAYRVQAECQQVAETLAKELEPGLQRQAKITYDTRQDFYDKDLFTYNTDQPTDLRYL